MVAFTWSIETMDGREAIGAMLSDQLDAVNPVKLTPAGDATLNGSTVEGWFNFETAAARGRGHVRLRDGKCWTLLTAMTELKGHEEPAGFRRANGLIHQAVKGGRATWLGRRQYRTRSLGGEVQPYCLIVGGGQSGLMLAARFERLGVPYLVIDALPGPGDAWRQRYHSLYLHDAVWMDHFPYMPFPDHWPIYMSKDKIADWLEAYCKAMEIEFWGSTVCRRAAFDEREKRWAVAVEREGRALELRPTHLVIATGLSGRPQQPRIAGQESFLGLQCHSSEYRSAEGLAGKRCVVIGANNSAHDICVDLWEADAEVVMIQRSPTTVLRASSMRRHRDRGPLSEAAVQAGITVEAADLMGASVPFRLKERDDRTQCQAIQREDAEFYASLKAAGFLFDFGEDETAIGGKYMRRASGYYIDVGGSELVARGEIKVRANVGVREIKPRAVVLTDGSELPADVIFYATGYLPMESWIEELVSPEVAAKVGRCWGLGSDTPLDPGPWAGELRNMWKPTAQANLWMHGGNLAQLRFHSLHLALQIKARLEGIATLVHNPQPFVRPPFGAQ